MVDAQAVLPGLLEANSIKKLFPDGVNFTYTLAQWNPGDGIEQKKIDQFLFQQQSGRIHQVVLEIDILEFVIVGISDYVIEVIGCL